MRNITNTLMDMWYELLLDNVTCPVYRVDAPPEEEGAYVLIKVESETESNNNRDFVTNPVIITEVVTKFSVRIDDAIAGNIDDLIGQLLSSTPAGNNLPLRSGVQVVDVRRQNSQYLYEDDGTFRYSRIITRNVHRVLQT